MAEREHGTQFWRAQARRYDRAVRLLNRRFDSMTCELAASVRGRARVLELAAGTGLVTVQLAPVVGRVLATDRSPSMLELLRARLAEAPATNVDLEQADALALPYESGTFDAVVMANLLHLLPEPSRALAEARRVLRANGVLCVPTFCHGENLVAQLSSRTLGLVRFPIVTRFSGDTLVRTVEVSGFRVESRRRFDGVIPIWLVLARPAAR